MELVEVADRLYALTPAEFTQARNAAIVSAKSSGDAELAANIKALRKPSTSAWLVNTLARHRLPQLDELLGLGAELRAAQQALDGDALRRLSRERHACIHALTVEIGRLAADAGHRVADATNREITGTLDAAVIDAPAAAAVRSGRLIRALVAAGFDAVDLDGAVAVPDELPQLPQSSGRLRAVESAAEPVERPSVQQQAVDAAREQAAVAERALVRADATLSSATAAVDDARVRLQEAEDEVRQARAALTTAEQQRNAAARIRTAATRDRDAAKRAVAALDGRH